MDDSPLAAALVHRWFASEPGRRACELAQQPSRSAAEAGELVRMALAASSEWAAEDSPLGAQHGEALAAVAYLKSGDAAAALAHAQRALALCEQNPAGQTAFDRATALAAAAQAHNLAGNANEALRLIMGSLAAADELAEAERAIFDRLFGQG